MAALIVQVEKNPKNYFKSVARYTIRKELSSINQRNNYMWDCIKSVATSDVFCSVISGVLVFCISQIILEIIIKNHSYFDEIDKIMLNKI